MPKSIYLTDDQYNQITEAARKCGYRVERGRGSELAKFVVDASAEKLETAVLSGEIRIEKGQDEDE